MKPLKEPVGYSMICSSWSSWIGLAITIETFDQLSDGEILAHCLYNMTWFGDSDNNPQNYFLTELLNQTDSFNELMEEVEKLRAEESDETVFKEKHDALMSANGWRDLDLTDYELGTNYPARSHRKDH